MRGKRWIALLLLLAVFFVPYAPYTRAQTLNGSRELEAFWNHQGALLPDTEYETLGESFQMHFISDVKIENQYYFYYIKYVDGKAGIGLAISTDGVHFTDHGAVLAPGQGNDCNFASFPGIFFEAGTFYLYYEGSGPVYGSAIYLATSRDGIHFTKVSETPVLQSTTGSWDAYGVGTPNLVEKDGTYYLFYHGYDRTDMHTGVAVSDSPLGPFVKPVQQPLIACGPTGSYHAGTVGKRDIVYYNGYYYMVFEASTDSPPGLTDFSTAQWTLGLARSRDLMQWELYDQNPLLTPHQGFGNDGPDFVEIEGELWIYYRVTEPYMCTKRVRFAPADQSKRPEDIQPQEGYTVALEKETFDGAQTGIGDFCEGAVAFRQGESQAGTLTLRERFYLTSGRKVMRLCVRSPQAVSGGAPLLSLCLYEQGMPLLTKELICDDLYGQVNRPVVFELPFDAQQEKNLSFTLTWHGTADVVVESVSITPVGQEKAIGKTYYVDLETRDTVRGVSLNRESLAGVSNLDTLVLCDRDRIRITLPAAYLKEWFRQGYDEAVFVIQDVQQDFILQEQVKRYGYTQFEQALFHWNLYLTGEGGRILSLDQTDFRLEFQIALREPLLEQAGKGKKVPLCYVSKIGTNLPVFVKGSLHAENSVLSVIAEPGTLYAAVADLSA